MNRAFLFPTVALQFSIVALSTAALSARAQTPQPPATSASSATARDAGAFARARAAYKNNDLPTARTEMEKAIGALPDDVDANGWMGFLLVKSADYAKAIPFLEKVLSKKPDALEAMTNLGNALLLKQDRTSADTDRAIALFEKVAESRSGSAEAQFNLGYAAARRADFARAALAYRRAAELKEDGQTFINLGISLQKLGRLDEATTALRKGISLNVGDTGAHAALGSIEVQRQNFAAAVSVLEAARKLDSPSYGVLTNLAFAYSKTGRVADAAQAYGQAADLAASGAEGAASGEVTARYNQGVMLSQQGKQDAALVAYEKVLAVNPRYLDALLNAGYVLFQKGAYPEAAARFKTATTVDPNSLVAWTNLGSAYSRQKDEPGAITAWQKAASLDPSDYDVRSFLAAALLSQDRTADAMKVFGEMIQLRPSAAEPNIAIGTAHMKANKLDEAFKAFQAAIKAEPSSAQAHNNLGVVYERRGQLNEAIAEYKRALELSPAMVDAKANLARFGKMADTIKPATAPKAAPTKTNKAGTKPTKGTRK